MLQRESCRDGTARRVADEQQWLPTRVHRTDHVFQISEWIVRRTQRAAWAFRKTVPALVPGNNVPPAII